MPIHDLLTMLAALAGVIVMILLIRAGSRLAGVLPARGEAAGALALHASLRLDAKRRLCLVDCEGQHLLLLTGGPSDILLGWLPGQGAASGPPS